MHPAACLRPRKEDHRLGEWRPDLKHRAVLVSEVREERWNVAVANMPIEQQLSERDGRNSLGQGRMSKQRAGEVVRHRGAYGPANQLHPADELDGLLRLFVELKDEPKHVTRVDDTDYDDAPGVGNLVIEVRLPGTWWN